MLSDTQSGVLRDSKGERAEIMKEITNPELLIGWKAIADETVFTRKSFETKYGKDMLENGFAFRSRVGGLVRSPVVWTHKNLLLMFLSYKQKEHGRV